MARRRGGRRAAAFALILGGASPAAALEPPREGWSFSLTPYGWFAGIQGNLRLPGPAERLVPVSASFDSILADLSTVPVMLAGEARNGRFAVAADVLFLGLDQTVRPRDASFVTGRASLDTTIVSLVGFYRVLAAEGRRLDLGAGVRVWNFDTALTLQGGPLTSRTASRSAAWADPVLAVRYGLDLAPRLSLSLYGDIGGFNLGSILTWQAVGTLDYRLSERWSLSAGWRYLGVDRKLSDGRIDVGFTGPLLAATFRF